MPNPYFAFRQFTIRQDACAMKVCTDACLFGAWVANAYDAKIRTDDLQAQLPVTNILDIGSGTGLLTLMLAQKIHASVTAIELDGAAFRQMKKNIDNSPWHNRITAIHADATTFGFDRKYDLIICNPPFYANSLRAGNDRTNLAKHESALNPEKLVAIAAANSTTAGKLWVLLPYLRSGYFTGIAGRAGLHCISHISVRQTPAHDYFRSMLQFDRLPGSTDHPEMYIKDGNNYSVAFSALLKDYYLH